MFSQNTIGQNIIGTIKMQIIVSINQIASFSNIAMAILNFWLLFSYGTSTLR